MNEALSRDLDPGFRGSRTAVLEEFLKRKIVGQDHAIERVIQVFQVFLAGLNPARRPVANLMFLGPTGSGKTRLVEAMAEHIFGSADALIKVDCAEFGHGHQIAKLIGSPPGYMGHRETSPMLSQKRLDQHQTDAQQLTLLLFDEIEKASDSLWDLLLGIMDKATLTLGDNSQVDFSRCMIFLTSNVGSAEMCGMIEGGMGLARGRARRSSAPAGKIVKVAEDAARRKFTPEFINRIDKMVVFNNLGPDELERILEIELGAVQDRILRSRAGGCVFSCTQEMKRFLLEEGTDRRYGARHLKRAIDKNVVFPLAGMIVGGQIRAGDLVTVDREDGKTRFTKKRAGALVASAAGLRAFELNGDLS